MDLFCSAATQARPWIGALVLFGSMFQADWGRAAEAANPSQNGAATAQSHRQVALADQLRVGLKAKTPEDKAFLNQVVQLVDQGVLPRRLVDSTFLWARSNAVQRPGRNPLRPIVYFRPALTLRARRLGVVL